MISGQDGDTGIMVTTFYLESICEKMWRMRDLVKMVLEVADRNWRFDSRALNVVKKDCINTIPVRIFPIWPFCTILRSSACFSTSIATQASPSELSGRILNEIISKIVESPSSGYEICYTYTHKLCSSGNLQGAAMLMQSLHDKNIFLGQSAYNCLIKAAGEQNDIDLLCQIFKHFLVCRKSMDSTSFTTLAKVFTMKNDDAYLLRFVREVSELIFPRNATVMNRIIYAFAQFRQVNKAMLIFGQMKSLQCKPDLVTYNTVLGILGQTGRIGEMLHVFASMKEENLVPDIISFNTLVNGFRKVGRLELCETYFKEMLEKGIEPDLQTYTALIDSFIRSGNTEESLRLFNEMKHKGICPSVQIYQLLISNLKKMGKLKLAEAFSQEMKASLSSLVDPKDFKRKKR
ncbi:pentatricopeptide repeat-containing protein At1g11900 isoform X1 [Ipomoea triloba]|uniref:pentatricopeptide repeat-containing protein At1g11900 isoform X1 n=1 Tax=Ipomoea triloba TaxID=35885 RepID=UPI00125CD636|nr:pentatricopeptide repeat-containing protein At1g11900 isoform X1 [Ipomoea triloba]